MTTKTAEQKLDLLSIIIPVYHEEATIAAIIQQIKQVMLQLDQPYEILVIDDGSQDATPTVAEHAGGRVISHPYNIGPGAGIKTGLRQSQGDAVLILDGDGQHPPEDIPRLLAQLGPYDMVIGARTNESDSELHRDIANKIYNGFAGYVCGRKIDDLTSGFRVMKRHIAQEFVNLLPNTFSYPATLTLATIRSGYTLTYVPIKSPRRVGKSKIKLMQDGPRFLLIILKIATLFSPLKVFIPVSLSMFLLGSGYGLFKIIFLGTRYGPTSALFMTVGVLIFLIGLVSEQITQLRFDRTYRGPDG